MSLTYDLSSQQIEDEYVEIIPEDTSLDFFLEMADYWLETTEEFDIFIENLEEHQLELLTSKLTKLGYLNNPFKDE